jgi:hypothetical protein
VSSKTARDLVTRAARSAGIIEPQETLEANEASQAVDEMNGILSFWDNEALVPYTETLTDFTLNGLTGRTFTVGKHLEQDPGETSNLVSGTITGLSNTITGVGTVPAFSDAVMTLDNGDKFIIPSSSTLTLGKVSTDPTFTVSVYDATLSSFVGPDITAGETLYFSNMTLTTTEGVFLYADVFIKRPNKIINLAQGGAGQLYPMEYVDPISADSGRLQYLSDAGGITLGLGNKYTVRTDYPLMTIEVFSSINADYRLSNEVVMGEYNLNDVINLPNGFFIALQYAVSEILASQYGGPKLQEMARLALKYLNGIKRAQVNPQILSTRGAVRGSNRRYNVRNNSY